MLKKYRPYLIGFYAATAALLIAALFFDLKLDILLNNPKDAFSLWFECMGEMPCRLIPIAAGVLLFYLAEHKVLRIFGLAADILGGAYTGYHIASYFFIEAHKTVFGLLFGLGIALTALYLGHFLHVPEEMKRALVILSVAGIVVMFVQLGAIEIFKSLWGRVRFRDLIRIGSYDAFTPWYHPNGINGNRSFPSGHTAGAAMGFLTMLLPYLPSQKEKKHTALLFVLPLVYTVIVAYTRMVMGAHYLSDVTVGGVIGLTTVVIAMRILEKKYFKEI